METSTPARRGRPPSFDRDTALRRAMEVFWEVGYEAATLSQLKDAMGGLCSPSIYAAFGSKEQLFYAALELYQGSVCAWSTQALSIPDAREAVATLLRQAATQYTTAGQPRGCLVDLATLNFAPASTPVRDFLRQQRLASEGRLRARLDQAVVQGELPSGTDTATMAGFYRTVLLGLSTQAQDGVPREPLLAIADAAMLTWDNWARGIG